MAWKTSVWLTKMATLNYAHTQLIICHIRLHNLQGVRLARSPRSKYRLSIHSHHLQNHTGKHIHFFSRHQNIVFPYVLAQEFVAVSDGAKKFECSPILFWRTCLWSLYLCTYMCMQKNKWMDHVSVTHVTERYGCESTGNNESCAIRCFWQK